MMKKLFPEKIIEKQKQHVEEFLPQLLSLQYSSSTRPKVQFFEGEIGDNRDRILKQFTVD